MPDLTPDIVAIIARYTPACAARVESATRLSDLEIDRLDVPMIILDIEDALDVCIRFDERLDDVTTIRDLVACAAASIEEKARWQRLRAATPRVKRSWLSTQAEQRR